MTLLRAEQVVQLQHRNCVEWTTATARSEDVISRYVIKLIPCHNMLTTPLGCEMLGNK